MEFGKIKHLQLVKSFTEYQVTADQVVTMDDLKPEDKTIVEYWQVLGYNVDAMWWMSLTDQQRAQYREEIPQIRAMADHEDNASVGEDYFDDQFRTTLSRVPKNQG